MDPSSWSEGGSSTESTGDSMEKGLDSEAEGVWSPDIEQSFQEALAIYPPCGRRKIILSDEGKMYGRNELIARYIKLRTGKTRTRKQVSSHIQVLVRRKSREIQSKLKDQAVKDTVLQSMTTIPSAHLVSATGVQNKLGVSTLAKPPFPSAAGSTEFFPFWQGGVMQPPLTQDVKPFAQTPYPLQPPVAPSAVPGYDTAPASLSPVPSGPVWQGCSIGTAKLHLLEFSAFMEQQGETNTYNRHLFVHISQGSPTALESVDVRQIYDKFPEKKGGLKDLYERGPPGAFFLVKFWADLNTGVPDEPGVFYGVTSQYEGPENMTITCSSKVCSFGKQVVEKVETEYARFENGRFMYRMHRSPMCEYLINFIHKLKQLPEKYMMNSVLENFTILQVVTNRDTQELLLCVAYVFEISTSERGTQYHIYRLVKE
ncbi:transcriptional enhancer factor TEF-4 [Microcaecilia unicolor]|uniref:Transcriptional enhancer factor TEF-4 n=1 Tax=Microcaecilia unicolor TaxID=1415580 RepID=A0A6P7XKR7_9AMPH|nr:transcriptional enhancer factor TEF-4 [Microcaecilia unicolor]